MSAERILVVDDDPRLREVVRYALSRAGFDVVEAGDGRAALQAVAARAPDLVVLDVLMPELDGLDVCRELRRQGNLPIVFLSSRGEEMDRVLGLELGGDDYLTKPFSPRELVSRVRAVLRRTRPAMPPAGATGGATGGAAPEPEEEDEPVLVEGRIRLDPVEHRVTAAEQEVDLTATEFRILQVLMRRPGRVFTREELVDRSYPGRHFVSDRTLDSHMRRIRQKFREAAEAAGDAGHTHDPIETVHGVGYRMRKA
ncbi:response regulator transcription factor [Myxococcota bacterium]|nr:response regulator transcription factor [Myxococcota bacterium]